MMSKSVMLSIKPKWCELIESSKKTIEIRKTRPKIKPPFKCYIYCIKDGFYGTRSKTNPAKRTNATGKVIGEFVCDEILEDKGGEYANEFSVLGCMPLEQQKKYAPKATLYGWHISDLVIYDQPKNLDDFQKDCGYAYCLEDCKRPINSRCACAFSVAAGLKRPPQSWCYVEERA